VRIAAKSVGAMIALLLFFGLTTSLLFSQTASPAQASQQTNQLQITTKTLPDGWAGDAYEAQLRATGGAPPYQWALDPQSKLPPGLTLSRAGLISGTPNLPGVFTFTIELRDQGPPTGWVQLTFKITIRAAFAVVWRQGPVVQGNQILGQVVVYNNVDDGVDLTLIVVAVNEVNKAFALGYERLPLGGKHETKPIAFGTNMNLPRGKYVVHVDAIGESVARNRIYRARQQTPGALSVVSP
jgi:Putative Ig domain